MTFRERYRDESTWHGRAMVMEIFHLTMQTNTGGKWTVTKTAEYFSVSIGLASENLRLADALHTHHELINIPTRQEALIKLARVNGRNV